jgi:hypothetical protein
MRALGRLRQLNARTFQERLFSSYSRQLMWLQLFRITLAWKGFLWNRSKCSFRMTISSEDAAQRDGHMEPLIIRRCLRIQDL